MKELKCEKEGQDKKSFKKISTLERIGIKYSESHTERAFPIYFKERK